MLKINKILSFSLVTFIIIFISTSKIFAIEQTTQTDKKNVQIQSNADDDGISELVDNFLDDEGLIILPIVSYTPETDLALGVGGIKLLNIIDDSSIKPSMLTLFGMYTFKNQFIVNLGSTFNFSKDSFSAGFRLRNYPTEFFGIGNYTKESDEESYTEFSSQLELKYSRKISEFIQLGVNYYLDYNKLSNLKAAGLLDSGAISGIRPGFISGLGFIFKLNDLEKSFIKKDGVSVKLEFDVYDGILGSEFDFLRLSLDVRENVEFYPNHFISGQIYCMIQTGEIPFQKLSVYGVRGFYKGRFRDNNVRYIQFEYRFVPVIWRIGFAVFCSFGDVAPTVEKFSNHNLKFAGGIGLRFQISKTKKINLRLDIGFSEKPYVYFGIFEAF